MSNSLSLVVALESIARIDRELTIAVDQASTLAAHTYSAHRALGELHRSLENSMTGTRELREDLLMMLLMFSGDASEPYPEAALRERTAAVVTRLADLAVVEHEAAGEESGLFIGKFQRLHDVHTHVLAQIGRVNEACFRASVGLESWRVDDGVQPATKRAKYRSNLVSANEAFAAIGKDRDLVCFVRAGVAVRSEPFRAGCRALATLLEVDLEPETTGFER